MDFTFNTQIVDVSVAVNALKFYRDGDYKQSITQLLQVLDMEPNNWQARLMLGACYYKTAQFSAAQRAFRFLYDKCPDSDLKRKAMEGVQASTAKLQKSEELPAEFGGYADRNPIEKPECWLD